MDILIRKAYTGIRIKVRKVNANLKVLEKTKNMIHCT